MSSDGMNSKNVTPQFAAITKAVINLSACRHNLSVAKASSSDSKFIAVIKANAYGHGMLQIADALNEADAFAVARINEAIELRQAGINKSILVLEGFTSEDEVKLAHEYQLDCVIHHESQVKFLDHNRDSTINVWLKIDTGMHRLGFSPDDVKGITQRLNQNTSIKQPVKFMTHLANADDKHDDKTIKQIDVFYHCIEGVAVTENSIANSAGILGWPQSHASWNRPGIMLYGVSPFINGNALEHQLKPVMTLSSRLIAIKQVQKGEAIGYGGTYTCNKEMTVGIVAIGCGDGYPRHAKSGTPVLVNNQRCALVGRVSMDMICIDLEQQPEAKVNDTVILWGNGLPVEEVAECAGTIAYELLCGVTSRVEFIYSD